MQLLKTLIKGQPSKEIPRLLDVSLKSVNVRRANAFRKTEVNGTAELLPLQTLLSRKLVSNCRSRLASVVPGAVAGAASNFACTSSMPATAIGRAWSIRSATLKNESRTAN
ncbi:LuxR C-terminal-related transcriptional regulator [Aromatoleum petrolei]|uniref:HTH luxR-type domain-containing protein n=1 Tax=Aromatoleum petrolei TaxID=76116 RepID=A0ABX1MSM2_9RHOO|nr:hypothetical protein [Aromatoleum petrolei]